MRRPIGFWFGQNRCAIASLMMTTPGDAARSRSVKMRPLRSGTPIVAK